MSIQEEWPQSRADEYIDDPEYDEDDSSTTGWCCNCGKECYIEYVDNGIGSYEYWGQKGVHTQIDAESSCCGAEVVENWSDLPKELKVDKDEEEADF